MANFCEQCGDCLDCDVPHECYFYPTRGAGLRIDVGRLPGPTPRSLPIAVNDWMWRPCPTLTLQRQNVAGIRRRGGMVERQPPPTADPIILQALQVGLISVEEARRLTRERRGGLMPVLLPVDDRIRS